MRHDRAIALALLAFGSIALARCDARDPVRTGSYVSREYARILEETRSPLKASKASRPQSAEVKREPDGILIRTFYDFNEGGPVFKLANDGKVSVVEGVAKEPSLRAQDDSNLALAYSGIKAAEFRFTKDIGYFAARTCLVGKYRTPDGGNAEFAESGEWIMGKTRKRFSIGLNYPPNFQRDYFLADSVEYGFSRSADTLKIFEVVGGSLFEDGKTKPAPSWVLVKIHDAPTSADAKTFSAQVFVEHLYKGYQDNKDFNWTASADTLLTPELLTLIRRDEEAAKGEVPNLNWDPFCACQNFEISDVRVAIRPGKAGEFVAEVRFINLRQPERIGLTLIPKGKGWRIGDIESASVPSLVRFLQNALGDSAGSRAK